MSFQPATVVHPDVELWATGYLRAALAGRPELVAASVHVSNQKPTTNKPRTVVVLSHGGVVRLEPVAALAPAILDGALLLDTIAALRRAFRVEH